MDKISAAFATAAIVLAGAGTASAQGMFGNGQWYGKAFGGATWPSGENAKLKIDGTTIGAGDIDYDTGYVLGAALGYDYTPNVALELEYAYRKADVSGETSGDGTSNALMLNVLYKFTPLGADGQIQPYFGGGLGVASYALHEDEVGTFNTDGNLAYQAIGGVAYRMNANWSIDGEVRWFGIDNGSLDGPQGLAVDVDYQTFDFLLGATYHF